MPRTQPRITLLVLSHLLLSITFSLFAPAADPPTPSATTAPITGQLLDPAGKPLADTKIYMRTSRLDLYGPTLPQEAVLSDQRHTTTTDTEGRFSFPRQKANYALLVSTDAGYVIAKAKTLTFPLTLKLIPWARLEGNASMEDKSSWAGVSITASADNDDLDDNIGPFIHLGQTTDSNGHFAFEKIFAGSFSISRLSTFGPAKSLQVTLLPGKTTELNLPIMGRAVQGSLTLPPELNGRKWIAQAQLDISPPLPQLELPADLLQKTAPDRLAWFTQWQQTPPGKQHTAAWTLQQEAQRLVTLPDSDGNFKFAEVPPGTHSLRVFFHDLLHGTAGYDNILASAAYRVEVPSDSPLATPLDLGTLPIRPLGFLYIGQKAPDFVFPGSDGKDHLLSEYKGKVILLEFAGAWCSDCIREMPKLRAIHDAYANNPNFAMISLSVNDEPAQWQQYVQKYNLTWTHGILGPKEQAWPTKLYAVRGYPSMWLIAPDGKILTTAFLSDTLRPTLEKALKEIK